MRAIKIDTAAVQLASAGNLADARQNFGTLSGALIACMDGLHLVPPQCVHVVTCAETSTTWLQEGETT